MGTNYYAVKRENYCEHCKRFDEESLHIGKSSGGWTFAVHVYPQDGIMSWEDMQRHIKKNKYKIIDEYGEQVTLRELKKIVEDRAWNLNIDFPYECKAFGIYYATRADYCRQIGADEGPNNLLRHKIDGRFCIGHGEGTWDLCVGDFC